MFVHYVNRSRYPAQETNTESVLAGTKLESGGAIAALAAIDRGSAAYRKCVARKNTEDGEFTNEMSEIIQMRLMSKFCHTLLLTRRLEYEWERRPIPRILKLGKHRNSSYMLRKKYN